MPAQYVKVRVRTVNNKNWGWLALLSERHEFCGEDIRPLNQNYSFADGHRVRLYVAKKNVHWRIPDGIALDIEGVPAANPPRRSQRQ